MNYIQSIGTVSYTHLDVYKRQALGSVYANEQLGQKKDRKKAGEMVEKAIEIRKQNGEGDPDARRRLRFFGVKLDD